VACAFLFEGILLWQYAFFLLGAFCADFSGAN